MGLISTKYVVSSFLSTYKVYKFPNMETNSQASMLHSSFREAKQGGSLTSFEEEEQVLRLAFFSMTDFLHEEEGIFFIDQSLHFITGFPLIQYFKRACWGFLFHPLTPICSQGLQLYNISEDPTESRNLVRWMNPARLVCRNLFLPNKLWCLCQYGNFVLLAHISRTNKHEQSSSPREEIIRRLQDLAIDHYR